MGYTVPAGPRPVFYHPCEEPTVAAFPPPAVEMPAAVKLFPVIV